MASHPRYTPRTRMKKLQSDKISSLPDDILHHIVSFLPMKAAVRTSILSTRWRYLWTSIHDLDFGKEFGIGRKRDEIARIVGRFLKLHSGRKVEKFRLCCYPGKTYSSEVREWIEFAARRGVQELDLDFSHGFFGLKGFTIDPRQPFKLPCCVYDCGSSLESLKLSLSDFNPPPTFHGFKSLQTLHLIQVSITKEMLETLLSSCPVLENFNMSHCDLDIDLKLSAPNLPLKSLTLVNCSVSKVELSAPFLHSMEFCGYPTDWCFKNTPSLVAALIDYRPSEFMDPDLDMGVLISGLSCVKVLTVCSIFLRHLLEIEGVEAQPVTPFYNLKELQLIMCRTAYYDVIGISFFFKICPCSSLERLYVEIPEILIKTSDFMDYEEVLTNRSREGFVGVFNQLKIIKIRGIRGLDFEIQFIKFFLEKAVTLDSLILIAPCKSHQKTKIELFSELSWEVFLHQILLLPKTSLHAKIILSEHDTTSLYPTHTKIYTVSIPPY